MDSHHTRWTVAVDLTVDLYDQKGRATGAGAFDAWRKLQGIVEETRGKDFAAVVAVPHDDVAAGNAKELNVALAGTRAAVRSGQGKQAIDTYVIRDGRAELVEHASSTGMAGDVESLLKTASRVAPADRVGLVVFAHGSGTQDGIENDLSSASLDEFRSAVKAGLSGSGHQKLDLLDFNGCKMASSAVAESMKDAAHVMVASADDEVAMVEKGFNGQNTTGQLRALMNAPDMDARAFGAAIVRDAAVNGPVPVRIPEDPKMTRTGSDTLIALDLDRYGAFDKALGSLGRALTPHLDNAKERSAIAGIVDGTPSFPSHVEHSNAMLRDTREFASRVIAQLDRGTITDDGSIRKAAGELLRAEQNMTIASHARGDMYSKLGYNNLGGVSTFLPPVSAQSRTEFARKHFGVQAMMVDVPEIAKDIAYKGWLDGNAHMMMSSLHAMSRTDHLAPLDAAVARLDAAKTQPEYAAAVAGMQQAARQWMQTPEAKQAVENIAQVYHPVDGDMQRDDWTAFVDALIVKTGS